MGEAIATLCFSPCAAQILADQCDIVIAMRRAGEESRRVVRVVRKQHAERVRLPPFDAAIGPLANRGIVKHGLVEVGHHVARVGAEPWHERPRERAAA